MGLRLRWNFSCHILKVDITIIIQTAYNIIGNWSTPLFKAFVAFLVIGVKNILRTKMYRLTAYSAVLLKATNQISILVQSRITQRDIHLIQMDKKLKLINKIKKLKSLF